MSGRTINATYARKRWYELLEQVSLGTRVTIIKSGSAVAALMPPEEWEWIQRTANQGRQLLTLPVRPVAPAFE